MHRSMCLTLARAGAMVMILTRSMGMSGAPILDLMSRRIPPSIIKGVVDPNSVQSDPDHSHRNATRGGREIGIERQG